MLYIISDSSNDPQLRVSYSNLKKCHFIRPY